MYLFFQGIKYGLTERFAWAWANFTGKFVGQLRKLAWDVHPETSTIVD
jgi:hypothetical protein